MSDIKAVSSLRAPGESRECVALLEDLLADARSGELRAVAVALDYVSHGSRNFVKEAGGDWLTLLAEADLLMRDLRRTIEERQRGL